MSDRIPTPLDLGTVSFQPQKTLALAQELLASDLAVRDTRAARTLAKSDALTVVLTVIRAEGRIDEHAAAAPTAIIPLIGTPIFDMPGAAPQPVPAGEILFMGSGQKHRVSAQQDCAFLIIIGAHS